MFRKLLIILTLSIATLANAQNTPMPKREFRGSWIQCINGQFQGMGRDAMQRNLIEQLDALQSCHVNAIMFQIRGEADAMYPSQYEPWSRFLTGQQGLAPEPYWDPLQWMIEQCHQRGMELHAWINPYRAKIGGTSEMASTHPYFQHPERFFQYGSLILFNPGLEENRQHICQIVSDIVQRYDVDGIHMDDYFYPYPQAGVEIPDAETFSANPNGFTDIRDWRRDNVNKLIFDLHQCIRSIKPWVKFGVSPFGIYHNQRSGGNIPGSATGGLQNYDDLYADVLTWVNNGWVDYNIPQLYWEIGHKVADHETLVHWWAENSANRPLFVGQDVVRTVQKADLNTPQINQLPAKMQLQRGTPGVQGSCLWYSAAVVKNEGNILTSLRDYYNPYPALQPLMPFIDKKAPKKVRGLKPIWTEDGLVLVWLEPKAKKELDKAYQYVVYCFGEGEPINLEDPSHITCITNQPFVRLPYDQGANRYKFVVTVLDRLHNESKGKSVNIAL